MTPAPTTDRDAYGYAAVFGLPADGLMGGYLIVCPRGRPLEFHCTEPVRPTRGQQILFGPTLRPYVVGELIGETLLGRAKRRPRVVLIADADLADAGRRLGVPTLRLGDDGRPAPEASDEATRLVEPLAGAIDLAEPFERVREAVEEAQRLGLGAAAPPDVADVAPRGEAA